jgi:hypothetical protein
MNPVPATTFAVNAPAPAAAGCPSAYFYPFTFSFNFWFRFYFGFYFSGQRGEQGSPV